MCCGPQCSHMSRSFVLCYLLPPTLKGPRSLSICAQISCARFSLSAQFCCLCHEALSSASDGATVHWCCAPWASKARTHTPTVCARRTANTGLCVVDFWRANSLSSHTACFVCWCVCLSNCRCSAFKLKCTMGKYSAIYAATRCNTNEPTRTINAKLMFILIPISVYSTNQ